MRQLTREQAEFIQQILVEECGYKPYLVAENDGPEDAPSYFVSTAIRPDCQEYRFCGLLGFGGKFRNNGNRNDTPYVDCYQEDMTPERQAMIERANARLGAMFK